MDNISGLPDELLVKILTLVPTKLAVSTCILSKRWKFLWLWLPKLDFNTENVFRHPKSGLLREFLGKNLPLHRAPVIESLRLDLGSDIEAEDFKKWVDIAVSRYVRELDIAFWKDGNIFPSSFDTCKSLVILKLKWVTLMDVPSMACLPSLKTLQLASVVYKYDKSLQQLLSICPVLEDLSVVFDDGMNMKEFTIIVPSLQKLELYIPHNLSEYKIDAPSLKYLKLEDWSEFDRDYSIENMPMLREAYVDLKHDALESVAKSITSVKRLTICSLGVYGDGLVFNQLEHLTLCVCKEGSSNFLGQLLKDSPNLRVLDIGLVDDTLHPLGGTDYWIPPSHVPKCLLSSLQIFKWSRYNGRPQDRKLAFYILKNSPHLKTAIVKADTRRPSFANLKMFKELALASRASNTCELVFVEDKKH